MNLHAILVFWDESPTWLAGCVASLARIGVDHLVAVDGRYPHFAPHRPPHSRLDEHEAILSTAAGIDIAVTLHRPRVASLMEPEKRTLAFQLVEQIATRFQDWVLVIDADEMIVEGDASVKAELAAYDQSVHCAAAYLSNAIDPFGEPGPDNDINPRTADIYRTLPSPTEFTSLQSRFWRVMRDMTVEGTHFGYRGTDENGQRWNIRPDIVTRKDRPGALPAAPVARPLCMPRISHRKNHRTEERRTQKSEYYDDRERLGLERPPAA